MGPVLEAFGAIGSVIPRETEFWSAIIGAVVGGLIAYIIQITALREGRKQRNEDRTQVQQAQAHSLLFKMVRIYSDFYGIHQHVEDCFATAAKRGLKGEPWQFLLPLANLPDPIHFSAEEMGMLLALKNNDVFNFVVSMDIVHNSIIDAFKVLNIERRALTERLPAGEVEGTTVSGILDKDRMLSLRPRMIEVNSLIESIRTEAKKGFDESSQALDHLQKVLREKLKLTYKFESKINPPAQPTAGHSGTSRPAPGT
jgi:hypothetical protein